VSVQASYEQFATSRGMTRADNFWPGALTPLLTKGGRMQPAFTDWLIAEQVKGVMGRYEYGRFTYNVVFAQIPESQPFVPRLFCDRLGRITDDVHYGFEIRNSRLWTESEKLNERFKVTVSPFQDDNWLRQLFAPSFIDWLAERSPGDFSFELAYGSLLCSVEDDELDEAGLAALWEAGARVATRIRDEANE
jgi:hypothetical protein